MESNVEIGQLKIANQSISILQDTVMIIARSDSQLKVEDKLSKQLKLMDKQLEEGAKGYGQAEPFI